MSADEIRRLAIDFSPKKGVYCEDLKLNELVYSTLLAYAALVERADAVIEKAKKADETQMSFGCHSCVENYIKDINYILRGDAEEGAEDESK